MRFGIFGDIHGNLAALRGVLDDMEMASVNSLACLGDLVGRGNHSGACVEMVQALGCPIVQGNHDYYAAEIDDEGWPGFRVDPLSQEHRQFLRALPLTQYVSTHRIPVNFTIVHASLAHPESWRYVEGIEGAADSFLYQETEIAFTGHTHIPQIFAANGTRHDCKVEMIPLKGRVRLLPGNRYLINPGSVGEPRDGDPRPSYLIYDTAGSYVELRRLNHVIMADK